MFQHMVLTTAANATRAILLVFALSALPAGAHAGSVVVDSANSNVVNQMIVINADVEFSFSDDALEAIRSGVALIIDVDFRIKRRRRYLWDPSVLKLSRRYRIERHTLADRYVITDLVTNERRIHDSIEAAIQDLGRIREIPIAEEAQFDSSRDFRVGIRARLDLDSLPAPLRPIAYISPSWRMSSGWYQWTLTP
jgi:Domain of unknown function (DUF4390)